MVLPFGHSLRKTSGTNVTCQTKEPFNEGGSEVRYLRGMKRVAAELFGRTKKPKRTVNEKNLLEDLPDDVLLLILSRVSSHAASPSDLFNAMTTCKRLKSLVLSPPVLSKASLQSLAVPAKSWSSSAHLFLKMCAEAGNLEASYYLGMITFYCLPDAKKEGIDLIAAAAAGFHAAAFFSLAIIHFNGSGRLKKSKNLAGGVALCARAAALGHVDAMRELGHCLQDGYGVLKNVYMGRKFLVKANAEELFCALAKRDHSSLTKENGSARICVKGQKPHPVNRFLVEWFDQESRYKQRKCSYMGCGRPETRAHEFRTCSVCQKAIYCSRVCQGMDWKLRHKHLCV